MVPDRWETVWRTLGPFGIFIHISLPTGAALSWIGSSSWGSDFGRRHRATSDTRAGVLGDSHTTVARNQILYDSYWMVLTSLTLAGWSNRGGFMCQPENDS